MMKLSKELNNCRHVTTQAPCLYVADNSMFQAEPMGLILCAMKGKIISIWKRTFHCGDYSEWSSGNAFSLHTWSLLQMCVYIIFTYILVMIKTIVPLFVTKTYLPMCLKEMYIWTFDSDMFGNGFKWMNTTLCRFNIHSIPAPFDMQYFVMYRQLNRLFYFYILHG